METVNHVMILETLLFYKLFCFEFYHRNLKLCFFFCLLSVQIYFVRFCFLLLLIKLFYEEKIKLWCIDHVRSHCEFGFVFFALHAHGDVVLVMASQSLHSPAPPPCECNLDP